MIKSRLVHLSVILFLLIAPTVGLAGAAAPTNSNPNATSISVSVNPPSLPSDGQVYPAVAVSLLDQSGKPTVALKNTTIFLSVSQSNVGQLPSQIVIPVGQTFAIANFTTTTTPGVTTVTASSAGLASASAQVTTKTPSGFPDHIVVFASPSTLLASPSNQPSDQGVLVLELTDDQGLPAKAPSDLAIHLSSSSTSVVNLPQTSLTIPANKTLVTGSFRTSFTPGKPTITASASGYVSGSMTINVEGPAPLKLVASAQPSSAVVGQDGLLMVALTDQSGNPARAPTPIGITLRSSNTTVATLPSTVVIPAGSIYTWVNFTATQTPGTATLTATSAGLEASSVVVTTYSPTAPTSLKVLINPNPLLSDNSVYDHAVVVQLMGKDSKPAIAIGGDYNVSLSSSSSLIGLVTGSVTIHKGASYAVTYFQSTYASGTTSVTASATDLLPDSANAVTFGPVPYQVSLSLYGSASQGGSHASASTELPADGGSYPALAVTLLDSTGSPAIAPANVVVQLSSSKTEVVSVDSTVTIPQGQISTLIPLQTSLLPGSANITASSVGLAPGSVSVTTEIPAPTKLAAYIAPAVALQPLTGNHPYLFVQLQDSAGNPARAREATSVVIASSNAALFNNILYLSIQAGSDYAGLDLNPASVGSTTLTASSSGLSSSTAKLQVLAFPFSANITLSSSPYIYTNQTNLATLKLTLLGSPLKNVTIHWLPGNDLASPTNGTTNRLGEVATVLHPMRPGLANITAFASGKEFGSFQVTANFTVLSTPTKPAPTFLHILYSYIYYIIVALAGVIVATVFLIRRRRKHAKAELEAGFEAVS